METTSPSNPNPSIRKSSSLGTRQDGYQNVRRESDAVPLPETQTFGGNMSRTLATGTATSAWASLDCSSLIPINAEYAVCHFRYFKRQFFGSSTVDLTLQVRRDEQADSAVSDVIRVFASSGDNVSPSVTFIVPVTSAGHRRFDYRLNGSGTAESWQLDLRGYHTRKKSASDANSLFGAGGPSGDSGNGGNGIDTGGAGL